MGKTVAYGLVANLQPQPPQFLHRLQDGGCVLLLTEASQFAMQCAKGGGVVCVSLARGEREVQHLALVVGKGE